MFWLGQKKLICIATSIQILNGSRRMASEVVTSAFICLHLEDIKTTGSFWNLRFSTKQPSKQATILRRLLNTESNVDTLLMEGVQPSAPKAFLLAVSKSLFILCCTDVKAALALG